MDGDGWALVYKKNCAANTACGTETGDARGGVPPRADTSSAGYFAKFSDADINAMRDSGAANNLMIRVTYGGSLLGKAYLTRECMFTSTSSPGTSDPCSQSTLDGPESTNYQSNGHPGISRWYVGAADDFGWIFPSWHIGQAGTTGHGSNVPDPYCTPYGSSRLCPQLVELEWWIR